MKRPFLFFISLALCLVSSLFCNAQSGIITSIAGNGTSGYTGDNIPATIAEFRLPWGVSVDARGNIYIADEENNRIRKVDSTGNITTVAGTGTGGYTGNGGAATSAELYYPFKVVADGLGNIYINDIGNIRIRKVDTFGIITSVAGNGTTGYTGDGIPATMAETNNACGIAVDGSGNIYIADAFNNRIRKVNTSGIIYTFAGNGSTGFSGDGGLATLAELAHPDGVFVDILGNIYIADADNSRIRKVDTSGIITTIAGDGSSGYAGDGGPATIAAIGGPTDVTVDPAGNVYIVDATNNVIRVVDDSGIIHSIAGMGGSSGFFGDGGPATLALLNEPYSIALDIVGNMYISDAQNYRIRKVGCTNHVATITGTTGVCAGTIASLSDLSTGGTWSASNASATVSGGIVSGIAQGIDTIIYTSTNVCGTGSATKIITVYPINAGIITGTDSVCVGYTDVLSDAVTGGTWSCLSGVASVSSSGVVTGVTAGLGIIDYTIANMCSTYHALFPINVQPAGGIITGMDSVCVGFTTTLSESVPGGTWSSSSGVATVSYTGVVTGVSIGLCIIDYTVTNDCGTNSALFPINVLPTSSWCTLGIYNVSSSPESLSISPNPSTGRFTLYLSSINEEPVLISITNLLGQKVMEFNAVTKKDIEISSGLGAGMYIVTATPGQRKYFEKVIVAQ